MIVLTGEVLLDLVGHNRPTDAVLRYQGQLGGSALNTALVLRQLACPVGFVGNMGSGPVGQWALTQLQLRGINTQFLRQLSAPNPLSLAEVDASGNAQYAFYRQWSDLPFVPDPAVMVGASWFHFGSLSAFHPRNLAGIMALLEAATRGGIPVSFDPNLRDGLPPGYLPQLHAYLPHISVLKCSLEDVRCWFPGCSADYALAALREWGVPLVVLTLGQKGAVAAWQGESISVPARPVRVVDTIGAGDTFTAGLIYGMHRLGLAGKTRWPGLTGLDLYPLLTSAVDLAAEVCTRPGAGLEDAQVWAWKGRYWPEGAEGMA